MTKRMRMASEPLFNNAQGMGVGMYDRIYIRSGMNTRRYSSIDGGFVDVILKGSTKRERRKMSIGIGLCEGIDNDTLNEAMKVPELYIWPPGVLPICISYIGVDAIYSSCAETGLKMYDQYGKFIHNYHKHQLSFAVDVTGDVCVLDTTYHISIYTYKGVLKRSWLASHAYINSSLFYIKGLVCMLPRRWSEDETFHTYNPEDGELINTHTMRINRGPEWLIQSTHCEYQGMLLSYTPAVYCDCPGMSPSDKPVSIVQEGYAMYDIVSSRRIDKEASNKAEVVCLASSSDGSCVYALDEDKQCIIKLYLS
jgi:hypothetical protein